jgi:hypothetical protein
VGIAVTPFSSTDLTGEDNGLCADADAAARYATDGSRDPPKLHSAFIDLLLMGMAPAAPI